MRRQPYRALPARAVAAAAVGAALLLTGCGSGDSDGDGDNVSAGDPMAPPSECVEAGIPSMGPADLADVTRLPEAWPDAPEGAVLCLTSGTAGDAQESATYASSLAPADVYAAYEAAMPAEWGAVVGPDGGGTDVLTGETDTVWFQVKASDGSFTVTFAAP